MPTATSSRPARDRMATPFQAGSPCAATAYPRASSSACSSSAKASSASLVSCRQTTSGRRWSSQGNSRGSRCLTEFTFQVAIRTALTVSAGRPGPAKPSVRVEDDGVLAPRRALVVLAARRPLGQIQRRGQHVLVRDRLEDVTDAVEPGAALVVGLDRVPGRLEGVRVQEHLVLGARVVDPALARLQVHRAELPAPQRVLRALLEAPLLLGVADRDPVLAQLDAVAHQHPLELWAGAQELAVLLVGAEAHHVLDAGAVVPGAVEEDELSGRRQVRDVALEVPLRALAVRRRAERHDSGAAGVQRLEDALDRAALARGVAPLEDQHDALAGLLDPVLQLHQLEMQPGDLFLIGLPGELP